MSKEIHLPVLDRTVKLVRWWYVQHVHRIEEGTWPLDKILGDAAYLTAVGVRERGHALTGMVRIIQHYVPVFEADTDSLVVPVKLDPGVDLKKAPAFIDVVNVDRWVDVILGAYMKEPAP